MSPVLRRHGNAFVSFSKPTSPKWEKSETTLRNVSGHRGTSRVGLSRIWSIILGIFSGFTVTFGRYQGVAGRGGFDGHWQSPAGFHLIVEVKTSETYAIKTATLTGYVDTLISGRQIPDWDHALGLYVVGRPDPELRQLENAITAERRTHQLRIISVESLLSLAELMTTYDVSHDDVLAVYVPLDRRLIRSLT